MSQEVLEGQQWLNSTYGSKAGYISVKETGLPGTAMSQALVSAMQIELGLATVTGVFGDLTYSACDAAPLASASTGNRVKILQYGLYSKGYDPGSASGTYDPFTALAVKQIQQDAGLSDSQISDAAKGMQCKAILGVDEYKLVYGGGSDANVRAIQRDLNRRYLSYSGICAADGVFGRSTAQQLIFALQAEEGLPTSIANGNFGPTTKTWCPDLGSSETQWGYGNVPYSSATLANFTKLAQYALYCVGIDRYGNAAGSKYGNGSFDGSLSSSLGYLHSFQGDYGLTSRNLVGLDEWMSLLVSTGNPNRNGDACDCSTILTTSKATALANDGYSIVGRYLTGTVGGGSLKRDKSLSFEEMNAIFAAGLRLFCIYQDDADWWQNHDDLSDYFSYNRGYNDAAKAVNAAYALGIPQYEVIFFAVDYDFMQDEVVSKVVPHFQGINAYFENTGCPFKIGIYSARNTCGIVSAAGLAQYSFVSDMSTGYSGNLGFPLPSNWAFDQILEYTLNAADGSFGVDKNTISGKYKGFKSTVTEYPSEEAIRTYSSSQSSILVNVDPSKNARISIASETGLFGGHHYSWSGNTVFTYHTHSMIVSQIETDQDTLSSDIKSVTISIAAGDGLTFDVTNAGSLSGCYPPDNVNEPDILDQVVIKLAKKLIGEAVKMLPQGKYVWKLAQAVGFLASLSATKSSDSATTKLIEKTFQWGSLQSQVMESVSFYPVLAASTDSASFTISIAVKNLHDVIATDSILVTCSKSDLQ